jgi:hypothetical protein
VAVSEAFNSFSHGRTEVVNVDPGMAANGRGWPVDADSMARLNRAFERTCSFSTAS